MEDGCATTAPRGDDEIELELDLTLGGSFRKIEKLKPIDNDKDANHVARIEKIEADGKRSKIGADLMDSSECLDSLKKREIHALRRLEAKKKREAKQQLKRLSGGARNGDSMNGGGVNGFDSAGDLGFKRMKMETDGGSANGVRNKGVDLNLNIENGVNQSFGSGFTRSSPVRPPCQNVTPFNNTIPVLNCKIAGNDERIVRPVASRIFKPYSRSHGHGLVNRYGSDPTVSNNGSSPICSSSGFSDPNSSSLQGGSSCEQYGLCSNQTETAESIDKSSPNSNPSGSDSRQGPNNEKEKHPKPERTQSQILSQMPCVTTTGNGPDGKRINGFLYRYSKSEVSIVCVCHGSSFSPAEFVRHAGGTDVSNPLRHITVIPSAF